MQRRWKFLAVTVTGVVAGSMALTSLAAGSTAATKVRVLLAAGGNSDKMTASPTVVKAGPVTFSITNQSGGMKKINGIVQGPETTPFVLLKTNLAPGKLPVNSAGQALEKGRVGKPVVVAPGKSRTITLNLKPGKYVMLSNGGEDYSHGEYVALRVTG
jgi:uncharacterized cupredoxin-like copper-binding protein